MVHVERRILADRKHEDHRRRRDLDAATEQDPVAVERDRVQDDEHEYDADDEDGRRDEGRGPEALYGKERDRVVPAPADGRENVGS